MKCISHVHETFSKRLMPMDMPMGMPMGWAYNMDMAICMLMTMPTYNHKHAHWHAHGDRCVSKTFQILFRCLRRFLAYAVLDNVRCVYVYFSATIPAQDCCGVVEVSRPTVALLSTGRGFRPTRNHAYLFHPLVRH